MAGHAGEARQRQVEHRASHVCTLIVCNCLPLPQCCAANNVFIFPGEAPAGLLPLPGLLPAAARGGAAALPPVVWACAAAPVPAAVQARGHAPPTCPAPPPLPPCCAPARRGPLNPCLQSTPKAYPFFLSFFLPPGVGFGSVMAKATKVTDQMFVAASQVGQPAGRARFCRFLRVCWTIWLCCSCSCALHYMMLDWLVVYMHRTA